MAESKFNLSDSSDRVNPLIVGAAVVVGIFVGIVATVKFATGQSEEPKKMTETPTASPQLSSGTLVTGLEQQLDQAKKIEEELKKVKAENETQKDTIEKQKEQIQKHELAVLQKDSEILGLKTKSNQQADELITLNSKFTTVKEDNDNLKAQVAKFQSYSTALSQVSQGITPAQISTPKSVEKVLSAVSPSVSPVITQPTKPRRESESSSEFSPEHDSSGKSGNLGKNLTRNPSQSQLFNPVDEKELYLNKEKNVMIQNLADLCTKSALNPNEIFVAKYMMVHILLHKNKKTVAEICGEVNKTVSEKLNIETDLPKIHSILTTNLKVHDQFEKRELNLAEAILFSNHFKSAKNYLPNDATASTLFGHLAKIKQGKLLDREQITLEYYTQHFLKKLKTIVSETTNVPK